jgi:hypothetical protein
MPKLSGAVADMRSMETYLASLTTGLAISDLSRIVRATLANQEATRMCIVDAIDSLSNNDLIYFDDAILIYFAGHGCSMDGKEAIIPCDAPNKGGNLSNLISHLKLGSLLRNLADKKGNNVVSMLPNTIVMSLIAVDGSLRRLSYSTAVTPRRLHEATTTDTYIVAWSSRSIQPWGTTCPMSHWKTR